MPLTTEYHLMLDSNPSLYRSPSTNEPYSKVSKDFNPIHTNPYFASLPGTIIHGMFTSAAIRLSRLYVEAVIVKGVSDHVFK